MYTLYYITESFQINTIEVLTLDTPVILPENLHFIALRKGIDFINHPSECISFTDLERLCIASRLDDLTILKNHPFRLKNSSLVALCQVDGPVIIPITSKRFTIIEDYIIDQDTRRVVFKSETDFTDIPLFNLSLENGLILYQIDIRRQGTIYEQRQDGYYYTFNLPYHLITGLSIVLYDFNQTEVLSNVYIPVGSQVLTPIVEQIVQINSFENGSIIFQISSAIDKNQVFRLVQTGSDGAILNSTFFRLDQVPYISDLQNSKDIYTLNVPWIAEGNFVIKDNDNNNISNILTLVL